jgi:DegV family protein with EDD domain
MAQTHIVTDSACDLPGSVTSELDVTVVPLTIRFGDEEFVDGQELSTEAFYDKMAGTDLLPSTAAPAPGAFEEAFRKAAADGGPVVCINLSSKLSATMQSAENAVREVAGEIDARVVDSRSITAGLGSQVLAAAEAASSGASAAEVVELVERLRERTHVFGALDTLDNLKKGGRIGGARAMLGTMLSIKPIIDISSGEVEEAAKQRTRGKAMAWLRDKAFALPQLDHLWVCSGMAPDLDEFLAMLAPRYAGDQVTITTIGPVIGAHGGPRVLGLAWQDSP